MCVCVNNAGGSYSFKRALRSSIRGGGLDIF
jgi:hypothetical protein